MKNMSTILVLIYGLSGWIGDQFINLLRDKEIPFIDVNFSSFI